MTATQAMPEVLGDEHGNWWAQGHVAPALMVLAVMVEHLVQDFPGELESAVEFVVGDRHARSDASMMRENAAELVGSVRHQWMRGAAEQLQLCDPIDDGAEPWTFLAAP